MPCIYAGLEATTGDAVIYMDADLQDPPELIPEMIEKLLRELEVLPPVNYNLNLVTVIF